jgi:hypothetical protein
MSSTPALTTTMSREPNVASNRRSTSAARATFA